MAALSSRWRALPLSPGLQACLAGSLALAAFLARGIEYMPLTWDKAYFTYLGQAVLRGEPIYTRTFMGYPPGGPLAAAGSMVLGQWVDLSTWLAPRVVAVLVASGCVALVYRVARTATGSAWAAATAALVLAGFDTLSTSALTTLEPKLLVVAFGLLSMSALQHGSPWRAGLASSLAASCWQPAALIPIVSFGVALEGGRARLLRTVGGFLAGAAAGALPALVYLALTDTWWDFFQRSVVIPAAEQLPQAGATPFRWLAVAWSDAGGEWALPAAAGVGLLLFAAGSLRGGVRATVAAWLDPRLGGLPAATLAWGAFNTLEFGNSPDLLPSLPFFALWLGWLAGVAVRKARAETERVGAPAFLPHVVGALFAAFAALGPLALESTRSGFTLADQRALVAEVVGEPEEREGELPVFAITAEEIYVLRERQAPLPFLRLTGPFGDFLHLFGADSCEQVVGDVVGARPRVVVMRLWQNSSACERRIARRLVTAGYAHAQIPAGGSPWHVFRPGK